MIKATTKKGLLSRVLKGVFSFGPAIFIIGYIIGTGSVTSMVISGADYGLNLVWALFLSCFFTYFLIIAISRLTIVSGNTLMYNFKVNFGKPVTIFIMAALLVSIVSSVIGVMGILAEVVVEWLIVISNGTVDMTALVVVSVFTALLLVLYWTGKHSIFIKGMTIMVALMALSFLVTSFMVLTESGLSFSAFFPDTVPQGNMALVIAGLVGTTMAAVVLVSRSILVQEEGWKIEDLPKERKDAAVSMVLTFLISVSIMICAARTFLMHDVKVENAIDMMKALEPFAGPFAMSLFVVGIIAAALSSTFPNLLLFPWLLSDYGKAPRNMKQNLYKGVVGLIALTATVIPIFGGKPIWILIASQALSPFVMPLLTLFLLILINRKTIMGEHTAGWVMNVALVAAFIFNCLMLYVAAVGFLAM